MRLPKRAHVPAKSRNSSSNPTRGRRSKPQTVTKPPVTPPQGHALPPPPPMKGAAAEPETESPPMDRSPPATQTVRRRPTQVMERKLDELDACLTKALTSRPRRSDVLFKVIKAKTDFLRTLIAAERDCHGGARPGHLVEVEWRFGVLERTIEQWAQSGVAAPTEEEEEPDEAAAGSESGSGSGGCSCVGSCSGFEVMGQEATLDAKGNLDQDDAEAAHKDEEAAVEAAAAAIEVAPSTRTAARGRWWKRRAALCGAAAVLAVVALGAGLALEFAAVAQQSVNLVPT